MRIGKFYLKRSLVLDTPDIALGVLRRCIVIRCELIAYSDVFEYTAICEEFEELAENRISPLYEVLLHDLSFVKVT